MNRSRACGFALGAALGLAAANAQGAGLREDFAYSLPLQVPAGAPLVRIDVPLAVYRDSVDPGLRDIRVLNGAGEIVPFALRRPEAERQRPPTVVRLQLFPLRGEAAAAGNALQLRIEDGKTSIEVAGTPPEAAAAPLTGYLVNASEIADPVESLRFDWPDDSEDFAIEAVISVSDDLVNWREVVPRAPLARLRHSGAVFLERNVSFPATRAKIWRVTSRSGEPLPEFTAVDATLVTGSVPVERTQLEVAGRTTPNRQPGVYEFDLGAQLPVDRVELLLPEVNTVISARWFARNGPNEVWQIHARAPVFRMQTDAGEIVSSPVPITTATARFWEVWVGAGGGGIGSGMPRLRVGWLPDQLVFATRGAGPFELVYGNPQASSAAVPIDTLLPGDEAFVRLAGGEIPLGRLGTPREAGGQEKLEPPAPAAPWRKWILWLALLTGVAVLAAVAFNLSRQLRQDQAS